MSVDTTPNLPITGTEVAYAMLRAGRPIFETKVQWEGGTVTEVAQQYRDKLMTRRRDRTDKKVTGYDFNPTFLVGDAAIIQALQGIQRQVESYSAIDDLSHSFEFNLRDGTFYGFALIRSTAKFTLNMGGKDERVKISLTIEAEDWVEV